MRVIAFVNQKGGVSKTTTVHNLGAALARAGRKVLLVDLDAQGSLTASCGFDPDDCRSVYEALDGKAILGAEFQCSKQGRAKHDGCRRRDRAGFFFTLQNAP